jgi:alpha-beta hydrolase superfamily lysophospholipase
MCGGFGRVFKHAAKGLVISGAAYLIVATALALSDSPGVPDSREGGIAFASAIDADYFAMPAQSRVPARDGFHLAYRLYGDLESASRIVMLVHGSGWHGMQFHQMARSLAQDIETAVIVPDLRGHGATPGTRGDVGHIGQLEEDLADLIDGVVADRHSKRIIIAGHSSGGGLVVRFAGGEYGAMADGFILIAPFLKHDSPTTRMNSGGWAYPATRRIVGLTMLNMVGVTALNGLPVISFAMPKAVLDGPYADSVTTRYSYRLNTSFAPRPDYERDLAAMDRPLLVLAGAEDEAFDSALYEPVISAQTPTGTYQVFPQADHIGILNDTRSYDAIRDWLTQSAF